jgi:GT2 family glycosyltransferase
MRVFPRVLSKSSAAERRLAEDIELLRKSPLLDPVWYRETYPDLRDTPIDVARHYLEHGASEGRNPHPLFDTKYYLDTNPDVAASGMNPLVHYLLSGGKEGRNPHPRFDTNSYLESNYWIPQGLRDFVLEAHGVEHISKITSWMRLVATYGEQQGTFERTAEFVAIQLELLKRARELERHTVDVSVIIPVYNGLVFTLTAIASILHYTTGYAFELIVADDNSTDATAKTVAAIGGCAKVVTQPENLGFLLNCNAAAQRARGKYIVFLNNDTITLPGWLDHLIAPLESRENGLTGSKLLNSDGTLQEAGGILWRDGSAWNYGRGRNARLPEFNYLKEVDYISGASFAMRTSTWNELKGFDPLYIPAYCEDSDLAFRVREHGLRVIYQPRSEVIHHEGRSHGRDTSSGVKAYQVRNQAKFLERWNAVLQRDHFANAENVFVARDRSRCKPHILFVDHYVPQWDRDAGSRAMLHMLRMFTEAGFQVSFWPDNLSEDRDYCVPLQAMGVEVMYSTASEYDFDKWIEARGTFIDYALLSRPHIAIKYYRSIRTYSSCKICYYGHDIHYLRMELERAKSNNHALVEAIKEMQTLERENWRLADISLYPSIEERDVVRGAGGAAAEQVPLFGYTAAELAEAQMKIERLERRDFNKLLFVGGSHPPNVDALRWFVHNVMPIVVYENPRAHLMIVGATTIPEVQRLESESVAVLGRLSDADLAELYATAGIAIAPLRFGGGVKGKMIEALLNAIPIVSTTIGMQGLFPTNPIAFVADDAEAFANAIFAAQNSREQARAHVLAGLAYVRDAYSTDALRRAFAQFVSKLTEH